MIWPGQPVVNEALSFDWVQEQPDGSNGGGPIDIWEQAWGLHHVAYCGMFVDAMYRRAKVDDAGLCHPSTAEMCRRARAAGAVWDGRGAVPPGALWTACGKHTGMVVVDRGGGLVSTIEGNHMNGVNPGLRRAADGLIIIPPAIVAVEPPPEFIWFLEDPAARPKLFGPWQEYANFKRRWDGLPPERRKRARIVRGAKGGWAWIEGPLRTRGPWLELDDVTHAQEALEARLGRRLRRIRRTRERT
jgi:hypothetical protein